MRRALVIEGGGVRGAFTAGAASELYYRGAAKFDAVYATSSGAATAAYFAADQVTDGASIWGRFIHGTRLVSYTNPLRGVPLMDVDGLIELFRHEVPLDVDAIGRAPFAVHIAATNCITGEADFVRMTPGNALALLRATMALPIVYGRIVDVDGVPYVDGGVAAPIPLRPAVEGGYDEIVAIVTRPRGYRRVPSASSSFLTGCTYPRWPALRRALRERAARANLVLDELERLEDAGRVRVLRPSSPLPVGRATRDRDAIVATVEAGRAAAIAWLEKRAG